MDWFPLWSGGPTENGLKVRRSDPGGRSSGLLPLPSGGGCFRARGFFTHARSHCGVPILSHLADDGVRRQIAHR
jgi:hypothetical protein